MDGVQLGLLSLGFVDPVEDSGDEMNGGRAWSQVEEAARCAVFRFWIALTEGSLLLPWKEEFQAILPGPKPRWVGSASPRHGQAVSRLAVQWKDECFSQLRLLNHEQVSIFICWCPFVVSLVAMDRWLVSGRQGLAGARYATARRRRAQTPAILDGKDAYLRRELAGEFV